MRIPKAFLTPIIAGLVAEAFFVGVAGRQFMAWFNAQSWAQVTAMVVRSEVLPIKHTRRSNSNYRVHINYSYVVGSTRYENDVLTTAPISNLGTFTYLEAAQREMSKFPVGRPIGVVVNLKDPSKSAIILESPGIFEAIFVFVSLFVLVIIGVTYWVGTQEKTRTDKSVQRTGPDGPSTAPPD